MGMSQIVAIALGGSVGALLRFWVANGIYAWLGRGFPHGTLFVNVSGSFLMGLLTELMLQRFPLAAEYRAAVLIGFLGAYTTFSTFAIESFYLVEQGNYWKAGINMFLSVTLCLVAVWVGLILGRRLFVGELYPWVGHGLEYGKLAAVAVAGFGLGIVAELAFRHLAWTVPWRAVATIVGLAGLTAWATLAVLPKFPEEGSTVGGLLGLFAVSAVGTAVSVGIGTWIGRQL
jgi:CrcB protein